MKKPLLLIASAFLLFTSSLSAQCVKIVRDTSVFDNGTSVSTIVRDYIYDSNGRLAKRISKNSGNSFVFGYDTAYYKSGKLDSIASYRYVGPGFSKAEVTKNTWSGDLLMKQVSRATNGSYADTTTYTYSGSTSNSVTSAITVSWEGTTKSIISLTNISFTGNNLTGATFSEDGSPAIPVTATYDSAPNPFYGMAINGEGSDFLVYFSQNNNIAAFPTGSPQTPFTSKTYTYKNGVMTGYFEEFEDGETLKRGYAYDCTITGISSAASITVLSSYPNPSPDGKFHVESGNFNINEIVVISPTGEVVSNVPFAITSSGIDIDLSNEAKGLYLVQLRGEKNIISSKLIKQ